MKEKIHPNYKESTIICACGEVIHTRSTKPNVRIDICSKCHPFFTGEQQRLIDIEGQVDRFYKKLQAREDYVEDKKRISAEKTSPDRTIVELELGKRATDALTVAGLINVGNILEKLEGGEGALLELPGIGRKTLIDIKKKLRQLGYKLPAAAEEISV